MNRIRDAAEANITFEEVWISSYVSIVVIPTGTSLICGGFHIYKDPMYHMFTLTLSLHSVITCVT